jgi:Cu(I)/Ag(I) efflux system periplasmic protein CusF
MRAALLALVLLGGAAFAQGERYQASGAVVAIDRDLGRVTIDADPIEPLKLPALGLAFIVYDRNLLDRLRTGRRIDFEFVKQGRSFVLVRVLKTPP